MIYLIAQGHNENLNYEIITPEPRCNGIFYAGEEIFAGDGTVYEDGERYSELIFNIMTEEEYVAFNALVGLDPGVKSGPVTVTLPDESRELVDFNGIIVKPRNLRYQYWYHDVVYRIKNLEPLV